MFTQTSPTVSLQSMAARVRQIRLSSCSLHQPNPRKERSFNRSSSPTKAKLLRRSMYEAPYQHDRMAYTPTKPQQAGARRPNHISYQQENAVREYAGAARDLPPTPRKSHRQDQQREIDTMKPQSRQSKPRRPLQEMNTNSSVREQRLLGTKHPVESEQLVTMIDDYLSSFAIHSPEPPRPSSSGTMFVDFGTDGHLEVSYRNGVNKKLPTPPVPSKIPGPSNPASPRQTVEINQHPKRTKREQRTERKTKPRSKRPSRSSRHDSVLDPSVAHSINISLPPQFPPPNRPLPPLPSQNLVDIPSGKSRPPQIHSISRNASTTKTPTVATSTYHTAGNEAKGTYAATKPQRVPASYQYVPLRKMDTKKPLPPLPPSSHSRELGVSKKKRHSIVRFVRKVLQKIEGRQ